MKKILALLSTLFLLTVFSAAAADVGVNVDLQTGDVELEIMYSDINSNAKLNMEEFSAVVQDEYQLSLQMINKYINDDGALPCDVIMAAQIAKAANTQVETVMQNFIQNRKQNKGWGYTAQQMGIKPGSNEFRTMKRDLKQKNLAYKIRNKKQKKFMNDNMDKGGGKGGGKNK